MTDPAQTRSRIDLSTVLPPVTADPDSDVGRLLASRGMSMTIERHRVLATRRLARDVIERLPTGPVVLDCSRVEAVSPSFIHEMRTLRDDLTFEDMNEDFAASWQLVDERLRDGR